MLSLYSPMIFSENFIVSDKILRSEWAVCFAEAMKPDKIDWFLK